VALLTLKQNPPARSHLDEFVAAFAAGDRARRKETERFRAFA
jgi:hypothetical protein